MRIGANQSDLSTRRRLLSLCVISVAIICCIKTLASDEKTTWKDYDDLKGFHVKPQWPGNYVAIKAIIDYFEGQQAIEPRFPSCRFPLCVDSVDYKNKEDFWRRNVDPNSKEKRNTVRRERIDFESISLVPTSGQQLEKLRTRMSQRQKDKLCEFLKANEQTLGAVVDFKLSIYSASKMTRTSQVTHFFLLSFEKEEWKIIWIESGLD